MVNNLNLLVNLVNKIEKSTGGFFITNQPQIVKPKRVKIVVLFRNISIMNIKSS